MILNKEEGRIVSNTELKPVDLVKPSGSHPFKGPDTDTGSNTSQRIESTLMARHPLKKVTL